MIKIDQIDKKILVLLQTDSNMSVKQLASELKLTVTPVYERIKKLERTGIIQGYSAKVDRKKLGLELLIFIHVSLNEHAKSYLQIFENKIKNLDEVIECHHVSGEHDYLLKVTVNDMQEYRDFLTNKLAKISNIGNVHSSFVMSEIKQDGILHVD